MPRKVELPSGAIEYIDTPDEKTNKAALKGKKASDLTLNELKDLVYKIAKQLNLIE